MAGHKHFTLGISAPHGLIAGWLSNVIAEFIKRYPDVYVSLSFTNNAVDLIAEGIDIHLTGGRIDDMNLIVRRLAQFDMVVCASPRLLGQARHSADAERPEPVRGAELRGHAHHAPAPSRPRVGSMRWRCTAAWKPTIRSR
ncbi:LysR substrate-binding domain-containing protein [Variovorax sp. LjRoot84]|uniref:LysR substrate-binding domain-containing protein n=1 Tax=Variovorax sp. LjRoot84 TaxID=3342340 RepID=UPI003ECEC693